MEPKSDVKVIYEQINKRFCDENHLREEDTFFFSNQCCKERALLSLMERSGYSIIQENGQRKYGGPPPGWEGPPPVKGCEVFVGRIPRNVYEDELVPILESVGRIYELRLMMNFNGENRGYAFVMYTNHMDAKMAIQKLNNYEIRRGKFLGVVKSVDNCKLFVGGIPKCKKRMEILEQMKILTDGVIDVVLYNSTSSLNKSKGFAFVEYENHKAAAMARRKLLPGKIFLWGHEIAIDWAEPEPIVDDDIMSKVTVLYIRKILPETTEITLCKLFNELSDGGVTKIKKIRDFAFIHFSSRSKAEKALKNFVDIGIIDGSYVEVTWAKPADQAFYPLNRNGSRNGYGIMAVKSKDNFQNLDMNGATQMRLNENSMMQGKSKYDQFVPKSRMPNTLNFQDMNSVLSEVSI